MIEGGADKPESESKLVEFQVLKQSRRLRAQSNSLERLTREAEKAAGEAGTLAPHEAETQPAAPQNEAAALPSPAQTTEPQPAASPTLTPTP